MRPIWIVLLFLPLAGCLGGNPLAESSLFVYQNITRGDPTPVPVGDCDALLETLNERALLQAMVSLHQSLDDRHYGGWLDDGMVFEAVDMAADSDGALASAPSRGTAATADVTGTNNQEAGVDEADILKTDGEWTYVLDGDLLRILHSEDVGDIAAFSITELDMVGRFLLLDDRGTSRDGDDRLYVIGTQGYRYYIDGPVDSLLPGGIFGGDRAIIRVYDLSDRSDPALLDEMHVEGEIMAARLVDGTAYVVIHDWQDDLGLITWVDPSDAQLRERGLDWDDYWNLRDRDRKQIRLEAAEAALAANRATAANLTLEDHLPTIYVQGDDGMEERPITNAVCRKVLANVDGTGRSFNTIVALQAGNSIVRTTTTQIIGGRPIVYGAEDAIVLADASQDFWWFWAQPDLDEATDLHWFDLDGLSVEHRASGRVDGIVRDTFGIDVHDGQLRVATTTGTWGRWWDPDGSPMVSHIAVFESEGTALKQTGIVGGIAPGERIWSARFTDDRAYLVTFRQMDPLWVVDLADPTQPTILGELEIPGVSTYIHPLSDDALLTIGIGPGEGGIGLDWGRIQVSLFDISDPTVPVRADVLDLSPGTTGWSWSGATNEHKAFTYWAALGKLAVPVTTTHNERIWNGEFWEWVNEQHVGLKLIDVDTDRMDLRTYGEVDQDHLLQIGDPYPQHLGLDIQRSYFLGFPQTGPVSVYALSGLGMTAHDLETLEEQGSVKFN